MHPGTRFLKTALGSMILVSSTLFAADRDLPTQVEADHLIVNKKTATSVYTGSVKLRQGSLRVEADKITIFSPDDGTQTMLMIGTPARFKQRPEGEDEDVHGEAKRIDYDIDLQQLILTGKAHLWRSTDQFSSEKIEYNSKTKQVRAGDPDNNSRVQITIQPKPNKP